MALWVAIQSCGRVVAIGAGRLRGTGGVVSRPTNPKAACTETIILGPVFITTKAVEADHVDPGMQLHKGHVNEWGLSGELTAPVPWQR